jgi:hypothetical protein
LVFRTRTPGCGSSLSPLLSLQAYYPLTTSQTLFHRIFLILVSPSPAPAAALRLSPSPTLPLPLGSLRVAHVCITARSLPVLFRRKKLFSAFPGFVGCTAEWDFTDDTRSPPSVLPPSSPRTACMLPSHPSVAGGPPPIPPIIPLHILIVASFGKKLNLTPCHVFSLPGCCSQMRSSVDVALRCLVTARALCGTPPSPPPPPPSPPSPKPLRPATHGLLTELFSLFTHPPAT